MERIGIYCGTFNPPHTGHLQAAHAAMERLELDRVIFVPAGDAPHKRLPEGSPTGEQRLEMLRIAAAGLPGAEVSDVELSMEGICYTHRTVEAIHDRYPDAKLTLLMGSDILSTFPNWAGRDRITELADLAVLRRGGKGESGAIATAVAELEGVKIHRVENEIIDISSTQLRRMIVFLCAGPFLPEGVEAYIRENGLYSCAEEYHDLPMEELEKTVIRLLNPNRVAHVLGCRDTCVALARHWGADQTDAARAGILHDITKALDGPLQLTLCAEYDTILDDFSRRYPKTLHARTGSMVAKRIFGENEAVVEAIRHHTTGKAAMSLLEKIVYVADYIEPNRTLPGVERLRQLAFTDLDAALKAGLEMTLEHLNNLGDEVSPESREALAYLNNAPVCGV